MHLSIVSSISAHLFFAIKPPYVNHPVNGKFGDTSLFRLIPIHGQPRNSFFFLLTDGKQITVGLYEVNNGLINWSGYDAIKWEGKDCLFFQYDLLASAAQLTGLISAKE